MKRLLLIFIVLSTVMAWDCRAQVEIPVMGRVVEKYKNDVGVDGASVLVYDNRFVAKDDFEKFMACIKAGVAFEPEEGENRESMTSEGYFSITVNPNGAIIVFHRDHPDSEPVFVSVKGRNNLGKIEFQMGATLDATIITADRGPEPEFPIPISDGETVSGGATLPVENFINSSPGTSRLVFQSYLLDVESGDTVMFRKPIVYDGEEYHQTQLRRKGFVPENDPLFMAADKNKSLTAEMKEVSTTDNIKLPDPKKLYFYNCYMWLEDYNTVYYTFKDTTAFRSDRLAVPMRFLEYELEDYDLDPMKYKKDPVKEARETPGSLNLKFLVGKAEIDRKDTSSLAQLDSLKRMLRNSITGGSTLTYFGITGVASPEGNYEKNLELANRRMRYIAGEAMSVLPQYYRDRTNKDQVAKVADWEDLAKLLDRDGLTQEAATVRGIIAKYPVGGAYTRARSMDSQFAAIRVLPFYTSIIKPRLDELRTVTFLSKVTIVRELTPQEILDKYNTDKDYREGRAPVPLYEYWHLFQMVKDEEQLFNLYRNAYRPAMALKIPWELPANNLANALLKRNQPDTTILAPFIDLAVRSVDYQTWSNGKKDRMWNNQVLVANQVKMMLKMKKFQRAGKLSLMLPDDKYHNLKQITKCLAGFWMKPDEELLRQEIIESSPRNAVVMNMATGKLNQGRALADSLSEDDPVTHYLRAQVLSCINKQDYSRMKSAEDTDTGLNVLEMATYHLHKAFQMDSSLVDVAMSDYYIPEKLLADARKAEVKNPFPEEVIIEGETEEQRTERLEREKYNLSEADYEQFKADIASTMQKYNIPREKALEIVKGMYGIFDE